MIPPLIPPQAPLDELIRGPRTQPKPTIRPRDHDVVYGMSTVGESGRINDRHVLRALNWTLGTRLTIRVHEATMLVIPTHDGPVQVTADGFFRIPFRRRRETRLLIGDRVLLIGHRRHRQLVVHPPAALDERLHASLALLGAVTR
ncbi:hypothetical protein ACFWU5_27275 [Nocardia sp. NPDC058640]|uniref:hypothetical protein n=1 Tax=Nocardia sp. NPDC058640 TaxID=3346571 RepID=UPI00365BAFC2